MIELTRGRHRPAITLAERATSILSRGISPDDRTAALEAHLVLRAHRAGVFRTRCRLCGATLDCPARIAAHGWLVVVAERARARQP